MGTYPFMLKGLLLFLLYFPTIRFIIRIMSEKQTDGFPETYDILPHPLKRIGKAITYLLTMHQLASHGDHFQHPLDDVFDQPQYQETLWENQETVK